MGWSRNPWKVIRLENGAGSEYRRFKGDESDAIMIADKPTRPKQKIEKSF